MLKTLLTKFPLNSVYAHCDIPCGIYDPYPMQLAAHTVIRMNMLADELRKAEDIDEFEKEHKLARLTKVKEEHAEILKHEVSVLYGDYFKAEHLEKYEGLSELVFQTLKLASACKQELNLEKAKELLSNTQKIAVIFYESKGLEIQRIPSAYPTEGDIVTHK